MKRIQRPIDSFIAPRAPVNNDSTACVHALGGSTDWLGEMMLEVAGATLRWSGARLAGSER